MTYTNQYLGSRERVAGEIKEHWRQFRRKLHTEAKADDSLFARSRFALPQ